MSQSLSFRSSTFWCQTLFLLTSKTSRLWKCSRFWWYSWALQKPFAAIKYGIIINWSYNGTFPKIKISIVPCTWMFVCVFVHKCVLCILCMLSDATRMRWVLSLAPIKHKLCLEEQSVLQFHHEFMYFFRYLLMHPVKKRNSFSTTKNIGKKWFVLNFGRHYHLSSLLYALYLPYYLRYKAMGGI